MTESKTEEEFSSFEKLLLSVRNDGPYQWKLILLFMVPLSFTYSIAERNRIILLSSPAHVCHVPGREETNYTLDQWHNLTIPWTLTWNGEPKLEECLMYLKIVDNETEIVNFDTNQTIGCENSWDFDTSSWTETPATKFNLVCENSYQVKRLLAVGLVGSTIGSLVFSILSDRYGRKPTFYMLLIGNIFFGTACAFAPSILALLILQFLSSLSYMALYQIPYILVQEVCSQKLRYYTTFFILTMFVVATGYDSGMAWVLGDWKLFIYATHLPSTIFIFYYKFLPESPRWLLSKGKISECKKVLTRIAKSNGIKFDEDHNDLLEKASEEEKNKRLPMKKVFSSFVLTKHLFLTSVILSTTYIVAAGINMNVHMMLGNVLANYLILRSFEVPGNIIGNFSSAYLGRKLTTLLSMTLAALCVLLAAFYTSDQWVVLILCGLCKSFCKSTIFAMYLYLGELFPTSLRASAYGIALVVAIASMICDPSIIYLGKSNPQIPYFIWFGIALSAIVLAFFLPETLDHPMPQTIHEAMLIGSNQPYCSVIHKWNSHLYQPTSSGIVNRSGNRHSVTDSNSPKKELAVLEMLIDKEDRRISDYQKS